MVAQLLYNGHPLAQIAGYSTRQLNWVIGLPRDESGNFVRRDKSLPPWVHVDSYGMRIIVPGTAQPFEKTYKDIAQEHGYDVDAAWKDFMAENPDFGKSNKGRRRRRSTR